MGPIDPELASDLLVLELALARRDLASLPGGIEAVLDDDFVEFGASGRRWRRWEALEMLRTASPTDAAIEGFEITPLTEEVVLATYALRPDTGPSGRSSLRSSIWVRRDGRWRMRFHQGTVLAT